MRTTTYVTAMFAMSVMALTGCGGGGGMAVKLKPNEMLLVQDKSGSALIDFTSFGPQDGTSSYRWRYQPTNGVQTNGTGIVCERYARKWTTPTNCMLVDTGSVLNVQAGPVGIKWSYGSSGVLGIGAFGWMYCDTNAAKVAVLPDAEFETYNLERPVESDALPRPTEGAPSE